MEETKRFTSVSHSFSAASDVQTDEILIDVVREFENSLDF